MRFFLGTHKPRWLRFSDVPLFVSARRLRELKTPPAAGCEWALDSGGFTELSLFGEWRTHPMQYAEEAQAWMNQPGQMAFAAIQDWMCEPHMLTLTGLSIEEHQRRTVASYHELQALAPLVPWLPVLQGWEYDDYFRHVEMYRESGVDLRECPRVGVGSVCRRQDTAMAEMLVRDLVRAGITLHLFGFKLLGLSRVARHLGEHGSSDSMAWSLDARRSPPLPGCSHKSCANCWKYARQWCDRARNVIESAPEPVPMLW